MVGRVYICRMNNMCTIEICEARSISDEQTDFQLN